MSCLNFTEEQCNELAGLTANAFTSLDPDVTHAIFIACLQMWAIGVGVGLIFSLIRKLK